MVTFEMPMVWLTSAAGLAALGVVIRWANASPAVKATAKTVGKNNLSRVALMILFNLVGPVKRIISEKKYSLIMRVLNYWG